MEIEFNQKIFKTKILFSEEQIKKRITLLAEKINLDLGTNDPLIILIVLNGAFIFAADLVRHLEMPTQIETIRIKSYEGTSSTGEIKLLTPLNKNIEGKNILIIEDIIETGRTIEFLKQELETNMVKSIKTCTLLNKPEAHDAKMKIDYCGFDIGKNFVIGYGLDLDGRYRNLPNIVELI